MSACGQDLGKPHDGNVYLRQYGKLDMATNAHRSIHNYPTVGKEWRNYRGGGWKDLSLRWTRFCAQAAK